MPILPAEPDIFPNHLLDGGPGTDAETRHWWALYTLPRREKELMRRLRRMGLHHYSPLVKRRARSPAGRFRTSYVPLFPGYVFLCGEEEHRYQALTTNCVSRCLVVDDTGQLVRDLRQIVRLVRCDAPLLPESRIQAGMQVRIRSGSLEGLEGTVIRRHGGDRLLIAVHFLQRGASVLLDDFQVERIDG